MTEVDPKDILIKAAEDICQGLLCVGSWFMSEDNTDGYSDDDIWDAPDFQGLVGTHGLEEVIAELEPMQRCAEGSIIMATLLAGGDEEDYDAAITLVSKRLARECRECKDVVSHNDRCMSERIKEDQIAAGHEWAGIFRRAAGIE